MTFPSAFFVHTAAVETLQGSGGAGQLFAAATNVPCFAESNIRQVRSATGELTTSSTTVYAPPGAVETFKVGSRVTVFTDPPAFVISVKRHDSGPLGLPDHVEVLLT